MRKVLFTLAQTAPLFALVNNAGADQLVSNLDQSSSWFSGAPGPYNSFLQRFKSGPESTRIRSVTIQQWGYSPANPSAVFVELYRRGDSNPLGALPNFAPSSTPTDVPDYATFIDYSTDEPIDLAPNTDYILVFSEPESTIPVADLAFTESADFTAVSGWNLGMTLSRLYSVLEFPEPDHLKVQINGVPIAPNNLPPDITEAHASLSALWPPNGKMVPLTVEGITDAERNNVTVTITGIQQDEPVRNRPGDKSPDGLIGAHGSFQLRAERLPDGNGRVYAVSFLASNGTPGGEANGTVYVIVPHDTGEKSTVVDDGQSLGYFDSTKP